MRAGTEAAPRAGRTAEEQALDALRLDWGHLYLIGHEEAHGWYASRHGRVGAYLAEDTPDELRAAMTADYAQAGVQWGREAS
jgi:hypothetical protein